MFSWNRPIHPLQTLYNSLSFPEHDVENEAYSNEHNAYTGQERINDEYRCLNGGEDSARYTIYWNSIYEESSMKH